MNIEHLKSKKTQILRHKTLDFDNIFFFMLFSMVIPNTHTISIKNIKTTK